MKILRTPAARFADLEGYPFAAHYTTIRTHDGDETRIHHLDEGPKDTPAVLCLHGNPPLPLIELPGPNGVRQVAPRTRHHLPAS